ncbi:hypothetical protein KT99_17510 [Shewanella benthica KT99]|uniref:Uncharacterized protein n=1 Tax=Shewanella benthica KT99 TaxID=314608 RepID=A9DHU7_9GAMM|nr:hypothetical protein KT99_17510 [Shewanella benthica KT99]
MNTNEEDMMMMMMITIRSYFYLEWYKEILAWLIAFGKTESDT